MNTLALGNNNAKFLGVEIKYIWKMTRIEEFIYFQNKCRTCLKRKKKGESQWPQIWNLKFNTFQLHSI